MKVFFRITVLGLLLVPFVSCDRDDDEPVFPVELKLINVQYSPIRLYSSQGEILDQDRINSFIGSDSSFFFNQDNIEQVYSLYRNIVFLSKDTAQFSNNINKYGVSKDKDLFLFSSDFHTTILDYAVYAFLIYPLPWQEIPKETGFNYVIKDIKVGKGSYNHIELYGLNYKYVYDKVVYIAVIERGRLFNILDSNALSDLIRNHKLAVQEFRLVLQK